jgi:hypothetical protein
MHGFVLTKTKKLLMNVTYYATKSAKLTCMYYVVFQSTFLTFL